MDDVVDLMTSSHEGVSHFLDLREGNVVTLVRDVFRDPDDEVAAALDEEPDRYAEIPRVQSRTEYELMRDFADGIDEDDIRDKLDLALRGKGAFSRFRAVVNEYPDLRASWFGVRQAAFVEQATRWLEQLDIEPVYQLRQPVSSAPTGARPGAAEHAIQLLDLLLLGAPGGKTELLDGRVQRRVSARSESEARSWLASLARQVCEFQGVPWRKRYVDGKATFDLERFHLRVEGARIELGVDVPLATWHAWSRPA
jgi:Uncharacterised protein family (UPF0158)